MENLLKRSNKLMVLVTFLLMLSSFSVVCAENGEDMPIERSIPIERDIN